MYIAPEHVESTEFEINDHVQRPERLIWRGFVDGGNGTIIPIS